MKTFKGTVTSDFKIVVPQQFLDTMRADAKLPNASFLKVADELHPENDDAFLEMILKQGMRTYLRDNLLELYHNSGLGGTVSPAKVEIAGVPHGFNDGGIAIQTITPERQTGMPAAVAAPYGETS